jgi:hypothetical protein
MASSPGATATGHPVAQNPLAALTADAAASPTEHVPEEESVTTNERRQGSSAAEA